MPYPTRYIMKNIFLLFCCVTLLSCSSQSQSTGNMEVEEFEKAINQAGAQILDVRTPNEFYSGHLKKALWADWLNKKQFFDRVQYLDKAKPVYVYCLSGGRSRAAADWLRSNGYSSVVELTGGINAWKYKKLPIEGQSKEPQLSVQQYQSSIPTHGKALVDFGASWCPPCVKMDPVIQALKEDRSLVFQFIKIDAGIHTDLMKAMQIESIPVFIIYHNGKEVWRKQGIISQEELRKQLK